MTTNSDRPRRQAIERAAKPVAVARPVALAVALAAAIAVFAVTLGRHERFADWLFFRYAGYWLLSLLFAAACFCSGHAVVVAHPRWAGAAALRARGGVVRGGPLRLLPGHPCSAGSSASTGRRSSSPFRSLWSRRAAGARSVTCVARRATSAARGVGRGALRPGRWRSRRSVSWASRSCTSRS